VTEVGDVKTKVVLASPTVTRPYQQFLDAVEDSVPLLDAAGLDHQIVFEVGNPYISGARATMLRKALDAQADIIVFLDHDLSWRPADLVTLIQTPGEVVAGTYRFKKPVEEYMGTIYPDHTGRPLCRADGCIKASRVPAGFLKVTKEAVGRFMTAYPELIYGHPWHPYVDLFHHGAHKRTWYGEDYAFSRNWEDLGGELWVVPNLTINHNHVDGETYPGNYHEFLLRQPQPEE
jgi:glycosyltransferase involved in cell wall biosynthesis